MGYTSTFMAVAEDSCTTTGEVPPEPAGAPAVGSSQHATDGDRLLRRPRTGGLIDVVSASVGAGHLAAARAIATQFEEQGYPTRLWDILDLMPGSLGQLIRTTYVRQVQIAPSTSGGCYAARRER